MTSSSLDGADGVTLSFREWPGDTDRSVLALHATGFCKEVWEPVAAALSAQGVRVVAIDQRGHGASSLPVPLGDWWGLGRDAAVVARELGPFTIGLGHSSGATAATMTNLLEPGQLPYLVLAEPVVFPKGTGYDAALAEQARWRRDSFDSADEARRHFEGRGIFARWESSAFDGYIVGGLRVSDDHVELACRPETEAEFYELGMNHGVWERLDELSVPVRLLVGEESTFHAGSFAVDQAAAYGAELTMVPEADHFLPMQRPEVMVAAVMEALESREA
ncbi:MAG: alpha/beta hydrolase [Acidimicrobiia bacterium]|nr:alpha/beta hydrolase [Acidimicrobiia bacterium]